jgi:hypothetical protein
MVLPLTTKISAIPKFYEQFATVPISITYERNWQTLVKHTKSDDLKVTYNNPDHNEAVFYDCHDITQYISMLNLKMEMGIRNTDLRILST